MLGRIRAYKNFKTAHYRLNIFAAQSIQSEFDSLKIIQGSAASRCHYTSRLTPLLLCATPPSIFSPMNAE